MRVHRSRRWVSAGKQTIADLRLRARTRPRIDLITISMIYAGTGTFLQHSLRPSVERAAVEIVGHQQ